MKLLEDVTQILELILLVGTIADSHSTFTLIAAIIAIEVYAIAKFVKTNKNHN